MFFIILFPYYSIVVYKYLGGMKDKCKELITCPVLASKLTIENLRCLYLNLLEKRVRKMRFEMVAALEGIPI